MYSIVASCAGLLTALLFPESVAAQVNALKDVVNYTVGVSPFLTENPSAILGNCEVVNGSGACDVASLLIYGVRRARVLAAPLAFIILVVAGFRLVISQEDESLNQAKQAIIGAVTGLFVLFIVEPLVDAVYGGFTVAPGGVLDAGFNADAGAAIISRELMGILRWIESLVAIAVIGLIVVQAVAVLASMGNEDTARKAYRAVFSSIFGILLIVFDEVIARVFGFAPNATEPTGPTTIPLFVEAFGMIRFLLMFIAIIVIAILVYAGLLMAVNMGNDELLNRGRTVAINAGIGLVLIMVAFAIVSTVLLGF